MRLFELVKSVLDDEYDAIQPAGTRDAIIFSQFPTLTESYADLEAPSGPPPDYQLAATRFAYIYKYTTCHADIVARKIAAVRELRDLFSENPWVNMAAIGGGPGSDFVGVIKHMINAEAAGGLKCYMLDREPAWGDTWSDVERRCSDLPFRVSTHFQPLDVLDSRTWSTQTRHLAADLFTFIYFFSEIYRAKDQADAYFDHLMSHSRPGSLFLFVDNNRPKFYGWFDKLAQTHGLEMLDRDEGWFQLDIDEEKQALQPYFDRFQKHSPKLNTSIAWRAYRKPC